MSNNPVLPSFVINGMVIPDPTTFRWIIPENRGTDGYGFNRYNAHFSFELKWDIMSQDDFFSGIVRIYRGSYQSGSSSAVLPQYDGPVYQYMNYTGVIIDHPMNGQFYSNYVKDVTLIIKKIAISF